MAVPQGTHRSEFTYDGFGQRVRIVEKNGAILLTKCSLLSVTDMNNDDSDWPTGVLGWGIHLTTQAGYAVSEGLLWALRREKSYRTTRALRKGFSLHWLAHREYAAGRIDVAFRVAKQAFEIITTDIDPKETIPVLGVALATLMNELAERLGRPQDIQSELVMVLAVLKDVQRESPGSTAVEGAVQWLEHRVAWPGVSPGGASTAQDKRRTRSRPVHG